ncbi:hypothetical protein R6Q57_012771 [Mikania cordata]
MEMPIDDLDVDQFNELMDHPWLQFPQGTVARNRCNRLLRKGMGQQKAIDYHLLAELGQLERMTAIIGEETPWSRLFEMMYAPQYRLITVELCGFAYELSLAEFGSALGLYTEQELKMPIYTTTIHTADDAVVSAWWPWISDEPFVRAARVTRICDPLIRTWHEPGVVQFSRFILFVLFIEWETVQPCTVSDGVLQHVLPPTGEGVDIRGVYVTRITRVNELIDMEPAGIEAFAPVRLDKRTVQCMRICRSSQGWGFDLPCIRGSFGSRGQMISITEIRTNASAAAPTASTRAASSTGCATSAS